MRCTVCGAETDADNSCCASCRQNQPEVQVMTREERDGFSGLTIEQSGNSQEKDTEYQQSGARRNGIYVRQYNLNSTSLLTKILLALGLLAVLSGAVVIGGAVLVLFAIGWLIRRLIGR